MIKPGEEIIYMEVHNLLIQDRMHEKKEGGGWVEETEEQLIE